MSSTVPPPGSSPRGRPSSGRQRSDRVLPPRAKQKAPDLNYYRLTSHTADQENVQNQAELFYLQKQIQTKTAMAIVMDNGDTIRGLIEWYDQDSIKVRGREKSLIYKAAIKYMYKEGGEAE